MKNISKEYTVDGGKPLWCGRPVIGADPASFVVFGGHWAGDNKKMFVQDTIRRSIDRVSFQFLNPVFAKDAKGVFDWTKKIKGADPFTFEVLDHGILAEPANVVTRFRYQSYGRDAERVYFHEQMWGFASVIRGADPKTFRSVGHGYGVDGNYVWFGKERLTGTESKKWIYLGSLYSSDDREVFYQSKKLSPVVLDRFSVANVPGSSLATDGRRFFMAI